ncbi:MAG TPA: sugar-binding protein [Propionicimonas sp.]|jgi:putative multiple sugar transport system substrate-binding protein|uniref:sugar-binding protein n=1 Tax=Propionicimonas sp. TaxID=1955623 RepID=UPI002F40D155
MRKFAVSVAALGAVAALALAGCSSSTPTTTTPTTGGSAPSAAATTPSGGGSGDTVSLKAFPAGSTVGVSLPQKTSENWVLAGQLFTDQLTAAGFKPMVNYANGGVTDQQNQIQAMITAGAKALVIGAIDGSQLGSQLQAAHDAGISVIAYDRLLTNTPNIDMYMAYDNYKVGQLQGQALLDGLAAKQGSSPWNVELIAGSNDDSNSKPFFEGAMSVLTPKITDGTLKVLSGQKTQSQAATQGWQAQNAQTRMDAILAANYTGGIKLNGVLSPNDTLARAALTSVKNAGLASPVITGQDSEVASIPLIADGTQYSTINKDTGKFVTQVVSVLKDVSAGKPVTVNDTKSYNNGIKVVPAFLLAPVLVTQANVCTAYDPTSSPSASAAALATDYCKSHK